MSKTADKKAALAKAATGQKVNQLSAAGFSGPQITALIAIFKASDA